ncbi:hypothetical protein KC19_4G271600 [Ceratodon purpureus]|uniref:Uncharacterized protein n=1 Tax=Ceratodon purpureus TaxID=3225 RepID=A0A8T0IGU9_CERPU|nr:hypothetical protein KC19_4G271600 [Ceratodon purpureus]
MATAAEHMVIWCRLLEIVSACSKAVFLIPCQVRPQRLNFLVSQTKFHGRKAINLFI